MRLSSGVTSEDWKGLTSREARPLAGTPLTLVSWTFGRVPKRFEILDQELNSIWSLAAPKGVGFEDRQLREIDRQGVILQTEEPGSFEIRIVQDGVRVRFTVEVDAGSPSGWKITETNRAFFEPPAEPGCPEIRLEELQRIALRTASRGDESIVARSGAIEIDRLGRILVEFEHPSAVLAFAADGEELFTCELDSYTGHLARLASTKDGNVYVQDRAIREKTAYLQFAPDGSRVGASTLNNDATFVPGGERAWCTTQYGTEVALLANPGGEELMSIQRRPDRHWFDYVGSLDVSADGSLVVLEYGDIFAPEPGGSLGIYDADGIPLRTLRLLPRAVRSDKVVHGGDWIAVGSRNLEVYLVCLADASEFQVRFGDAPMPAETIGTFAFSPDGRELWLVDCEPLELRRYRMP